MKPKVYISGPASNNFGWDINSALWYAENVARLDCIPFVPQLSLLWQIHSPHDPQWWKEYNLAWIDGCDALFRIDGESEEADEEAAHALFINIPVFSGALGLAQLKDWVKERNN